MQACKLDTLPNGRQLTHGDYRDLSRPLKRLVKQLGNGSWQEGLKVIAVKDDAAAEAMQLLGVPLEVCRSRGCFGVLPHIIGMFKLLTAYAAGHPDGRQSVPGGWQPKSCRTSTSWHRCTSSGPDAPLLLFRFSKPYLETMCIAGPCDREGVPSHFSKGEVTFPASPGAIVGRSGAKALTWLVLWTVCWPLQCHRHNGLGSFPL